MRLLFLSFAVYTALTIGVFPQFSIGFTAKVDESLLEEFDGLIFYIVGEYDGTDPVEVQQRSFAAKARVYEVGEKADMVLAALIARGLSQKENQNPPWGWKSSHRLERIVLDLRYSPSVAPYLAPAVRQWLQYVADGKSIYLSGAMVEQSAIYLLHTGGNKERPFLEKIDAQLVARAKVDAGYFGMGGIIREYLDGKDYFEAMAPIPFHQVCGNLVERARENMEAKGVNFSEYLAEQKAKLRGNTTEPSVEKVRDAAPSVAQGAGEIKPEVSIPPETPNNEREWVAWLTVVIVVTGGAAWFLLRNSSK